MNLTQLQCPLFRGMEEEELTTLLGCLNAQERRYRKGDIIFLEGTPVTQIGVVLSGKVMIELGDVWGNNSVLSSVTPGGTFAESYACIPNQPLLVNILAAEDTTVLLLDAKIGLSPCATVCSCHARLIRNLVTLCAQKNVQLSRRVLHTAPKSIRKRLLSYFSECMKRAGQDSFEIPYNRQQLADYLNVERSALCNELSAMQRDGLIVYHRNHFTVSRTLEV